MLVGCIVVVAHWILTLSPTSPVPPAAIVPLGTAGYALPLATNVMVTAMISTKILSVYYRMRKVVEYETIKLYTNIVTILIESAAPPAVFGVLSSALMLSPSIEWQEAVFLMWTAMVVCHFFLLIFSHKKR